MRLEQVAAHPPFPPPQALIGPLNFKWTAQTDTSSTPQTPERSRRTGYCRWVGGDGGGGVRRPDARS
jgi:hypothetical protein